MTRQARTWGRALGVAGAVVALGLAGCGPGKGGAARKFTDAELKARTPWDLGPDTIDVTSYPPAQQAGYALFAKTCGGCHSLARPINAPMVAREQWLRFIRRMHLKAAGSLVTKAQANQIADFLAYDSTMRKVNRRAAYLDQIRALNLRYADLEVERATVRIEEGIKLAKDRGYVSP